MSNDPPVGEVPRGVSPLGGLQMAGMGPKRQLYGSWVYPSIVAVLAMVGLEEVGVYISRHQDTVAQYIPNRPIMDLCLAAERNLGMRLSGRWWEQPALDIMDIRTVQVTTEER